MKQLLALLFCTVLLVTVACPVWAEESTTDIVDTTTEPTSSSMIVIGTTDPTESTTESTEPTEGTTAPPVRHAVFLTIAYENGSIVIRAKDVNGQPVRNAPVTVAADSEQFFGNTNDGGVVKFAMATEPAQIICSTEAFKGTLLYYEAASASVILHTPTSATTTVPTTVDTTTTTKKPSTSYITGTSVTWTTSDPLQGNVTVTEIITSTSYIEDEEEEEDLQPAPKKSALPEGWALALMIMGGVLLIVAAVVLCLFLFRAPRLPVKEEAKEEAPAPVQAPVLAEEPGEDAADETDEEPAEQPEEPGEDPSEDPVEDPADTAPKTVSLEDLFRNQ